MNAPTTRWLLIFGALAAGYLYPFPYFAFLNNPNENVRLYQARAVVEHGTLSIGRRVVRGTHVVDLDGPIERFGPVNDKALVCEDGGAPPRCSGRLYPAKAPGTSALAVVPFALASWIGRAAGVAALDPLEATWICRLACSVLPTLLLLWFLRRYLARETGSAWAADLTCVACGLASLGYTYGLQLTGHQQAALALGGAFLALEEARVSGRVGLLLLGGMLLGAAPGLEYPAALGSAALFAFALSAPELRRRLGWVILGAAGPLLGLAAYHWVAFGSPLATPYDHMENLRFSRSMSTGFHGVAVPRLPSFLGVFVGPPAGLVFHAPWVLLALPGGVALWRSGRRSTLLAVAGVAAAALYFGSSLDNWRYMLGWTHGPRYVTFAMPMLAVAAAWGLAWLERRASWTASAAGGLVLAALVLTGLPSVLFPFAPIDFTNPVFQLHLPLLQKGLCARTLGHLVGLQGIWALLPWVFVALTAFALAHDRPPRAGRSRRTLRMLGSLLVAVLLLATLSLPFRGASERRDYFVAWVQQRWEPAPASEDGP